MPVSETERQECRRHPGFYESWRWVWGEGSTIEDSDPQIVESCSECIRESEAEDRAELRRHGYLPGED